MNRVQQYSASGELIQTFTGTGTDWCGVGLEPDGNVAVAYRYITPDVLQGGIDIFSPEGEQIATFSTPAVMNSDDLAVFSDGVLAITDPSGPVQEYTESGTFVRTLPMGPGTFHFGDSVAMKNNTLWVADEVSDTLMNQSETGTILKTFQVPFEPRDMAVEGDGSLFISTLSSGDVYHYSSSGLLLGEFPTALSQSEGIGLSPDGQIVYVTAETSLDIYEYSTNGILLGSIPIIAPQRSEFIAVVPEPTMMTAVAGLYILLIARSGRGRPCRNGI